MALRRLLLVAAALLVLAACSDNPPDLVTRPTVPPGGTSSLQRATRTVPTLAGLPASPWGKVPVVAPRDLTSTANAYYYGAGPLPEHRWPGGPACLLLLPTARNANLGAVPSSDFNVLGQFVVSWAPAHGRGTALTLSVVTPGDPSDQPYFAAGARATTFSDGSQLRAPPGQSRNVLILIPIENCEYELQPKSELPASSDAAVIAALRLVYAPSS